MAITQHPATVMNQKAFTRGITLTTSEQITQQIHKIPAAVTYLQFPIHVCF